MRRTVAGLSVAIFIVAPGALTFAKEGTIRGQLVDQTCYTKDKANNGKDHKMPQDVVDYAISCAK